MLKRLFRTTTLILALCAATSATGAVSTATAAECDISLLAGTMNPQYLYPERVSAQLTPLAGTCRMQLADAIRFQYGYSENAALVTVAPAHTDHLMEMAAAIRAQYGYPGFSTRTFQ